MPAIELAINGRSYTVDADPQTPLLHVLSEQAPENGFSPSAPDLEDVFFTKIQGWN